MKFRCLKNLIADIYTGYIEAAFIDPAQTPNVPENADAAPADDAADGDQKRQQYNDTTTIDLRDLVDNILEIDGYKSKMGADKDIVTVAFATKTKESADDLAAFIERGYTFVLDADATAGEQADGTYKVFVEIQRDDAIGEQIMELARWCRKSNRNGPTLSSVTTKNSVASH